MNRTTAALAASSSPRHLLKAIGLGLVNGVLLSAVMVPLFLTGVSPLPKPPSLAFAEMLVGHSLPLPVGLLFHLAYVTLWSALFIMWVRPPVTFLKALWLGLALWVVALVVFFPLIGWGLLGLGVSPKLIPAALVPHLLFSLFLWALARRAVPGPSA